MVYPLSPTSSGYSNKLPDPLKQTAIGLSGQMLSILKLNAWDGHRENGLNILLINHQWKDMVLNAFPTDIAAIRQIYIDTRIQRMSVQRYISEHPDCDIDDIDEISEQMIDEFNLTERDMLLKLEREKVEKFFYQKTAELLDEAQKN